MTRAAQLGGFVQVVDAQPLDSRLADDGRHLEHAVSVGVGLDHRPEARTAEAAAKLLDVPA
jgi:hypothetical protein